MYKANENVLLVYPSAWWVLLALSHVGAQRWTVGLFRFGYLAEPLF